MTTSSSDAVAGTNARAQEYNDLRKDLLLGKGNSGSETVGVNTTIDWSDTTKGNDRDITLTQNTTLIFSNVSTRQKMLLHLIQDGTGSRTVTWPSGIKWPFGVVPTLTTDPNRIDTFGIIQISVGSYRGYILGQGLT